MIQRIIGVAHTVLLAVPIFAASHEGMEELPAIPHDKPVAILAPPAGVAGQDTLESPAASPLEAHVTMVETFFNVMAGDDSVVDSNEFSAWLVSFRAPPMHKGPPPESGHHIDPPPKDHSEGEHMMDGIFVAGNGDLAGLSEPPACSAELHDSELRPQEEGISCSDRDGNLVFRTICNIEGFEAAVISLPKGRAAACFGLEALQGEISFAIDAADGSPIWNTTMGKESYMGLKLDGPGSFHIRAVGGSPDGSVTVRFVDTPQDL